MSNSRHQDLASALRGLRAESGLTSATVARRAGMSTAKLSKLENARVLPSVADVERLLTALRTPDAIREELMALAQEAVTEQRAWRVYKQLGFHKKQVEISAIEAQCSTVRLFQPAMIPGLLQSAEYVQSIFDRQSGMSDEERARTVDNRLRRQCALYDQGKKFHFIVCESALRWLTIPPPAMATQLDRLESLSRLSSVSVDVIPFSGMKTDFPMTAFCIFDQRLVTVETLHAEISTRDPKDIGIYIEFFEEMRQLALGEEATRVFLADLASQMVRSGS
ncbi:helix-turn-helix transcriptional regulator [Nocardiopsis rhodophaea]|uniref:Helix-turn-helix transcriptional regulator n=1 Tax=Nocardiopsis rhodophaea TaxID=280238 RepID=A0ABN2SHA7_9ACTN